MNTNNIIVGIDIGSSTIRTVIAQEVKNEQNLRVIGVSSSPSFGVRRGVVVDVDEVSKILNETLEKGERMAGVAVKDAVVAIGGSEISFQKSKGVIAVGRADGEVTEDDLKRVVAEAQMISLPLNREIIHVVPRKYRLDDQDNIKDPLGMKGVRLEADVLIMEGSASQMKNISKALNQAGVEMSEGVLEPLAAASSVLSKKQKELGVVLVNIGGGTTSVAVYEEGELIHVAILPVGGGHITNDIAIGLRTSVDVAEKIKLEYGCALTRDINGSEEIDLSKFDSREEGAVLHFHVAEIIEARLEEIFSMVNKELKEIGKANLLPAGAVLVGGGAKMPQIVDLAKEILRLPIQVGFPQNLGGMLDKVDDPSFSTVVGLLLWSQENHMQSQLIDSSKGGWALPIQAQDSVKKVHGWIKKFLP